MVVKQIHHEPCDYYTFGNKIEAELRDYERLQKAGIRIPRMHTVDRDAERIDQKETIMELSLGRDFSSNLPEGLQLREMDQIADREALEWLFWQGFDHGDDREAFSRAKALGAKKAYVISDLPFYEKLGFQKAQHYSFYRKEK